MSDQDDNQVLHLFCQEWAEWHRSRRLFAPPIPRNILQRLREPYGSGEVPDAILSSDASIFNLAVLGQRECRGKLIFYLYYVHRVGNIKMVAEQMGISRSMWYRQMKDFRAKAYRSYRGMVESPIENPFAEDLEEEEESVNQKG